jgi:hypothetical protein
LQRILSGRRIQHQPDRVRRAFKSFSYHAVDLFELFHQIEASVQTSCRIDDDQINITGHSRLHGIKRNCAGI